ncbi:hypothetical protein XM75_c21352 [Vibrio vulnificus]|nr:hypothetical protein XM75_c21352 [Vibrio vulnificus]
MGDSKMANVFGQKCFSKIANLAKREVLKVWKIRLRDCPVSLKQITHNLAGSRYIAKLFCKIEKTSFVYDDWISSMKHESYLLLSLITDSAPLIKVGNSLLFKLKCQI